MGDRCYMSTNCRPEDEQLFENLGFYREDDSDPTEIGVHMVDEEANYGHYDSLTGLAKDGIPFFGWHDAGGDYCAQLVAACNGEYADTPQIECEPVARILPNGTVSPGGLTAVLDYYRVQAAAEAAIKASTTADVTTAEAAARHIWDGKAVAGGTFERGE